MITSNEQRRAFLSTALDPRRSLRVRVGFAFGSLIILLALLLSYLIERPTQTQVERDIGNNLASQSFQIAERLDQEVVEHAEDLQFLASLPTIRGPAVPLTEKSALLERVRQTHEEYAWLGLVNPEGIVMASSGLLSTGTDVEDRDWFEQGQQRLHVGEIEERIADTGRTEQLVSLAAPIGGSAARAEGVVGAYLNWQWAPAVGSAWLATSPNPTEFDLFILSQNGQLLYGSTAPAVNWLALASTIEAQEGEYGYSSEEWEDGEIYLTGYAHTPQRSDDPALGWLVLVRQNRAQAFAPVRRLQIQILLIGTGLGLLFLALGWFLAGRIASPLSRIALAADRIRAGDMSAEIPAQAGSGEIATLAHSLHSMVDTLVEQKATLARNQESLEQRVLERTRTLTALYQVLEVANMAEDLPDALQDALPPVLAAVGGDAAFIHVVEGDTLQIVAYQGVTPETVASWRRHLSGGDPLLKVLRRQEPVTRAPLGSAFAGFEVPFTTYIGTPITSGGEISGILSVLGREPQQLVDDALPLLDSVADELGVIIENAHLQQRAEQLAVLEERNRLARELHDSVTQSLYSLTLFAEAGRRMLADDELAAALEYFGDVGETSQQALKEMRLLLHKLRPAALQQEGLIRALRQRLNAVEERSGIENQLVVDGAPRLTPEVEEALYHIATEALNNALRHAHADRVRITLREMENESVELLVVDNGEGFDLAEAEESGGMGLANMRERARHADGTLTIQTAPGQGTTVRVRLHKQADR